MARLKPGPKPDPSKAKSFRFTLRMRPAWRDWLERYARSKGRDMSVLLADAVEDAARRDGFEPPPDR